MINKVKQLIEEGLYGNLFYWVPVFIAAGIILYYALPYEPDQVFIQAIFAGLSVVTIGLLSVKRYWSAAVLSIPAFILLGVVLVQHRTHSVELDMLAEETGVIRIEGRVSDIEARDSAHRVFLDSVHAADSEYSPPELPQSLRLKAYDVGEIGVGDRVSVLAKLSPPGRPVIPGGFDFQRYAYYRGIGAVGFTLSEFEVLEKNTDASWQFFARVRQKIIAHLDRIENEDQAGIAKALLTGERRAVPEEVLQKIRDSGLAHLLSISGLHIGIVAGFVFFVLRYLMACWPWFALRYPIKKIASVFAILSAVLFMLLVGAPIPTQRAVVMTGLFFIAILFDRSPVSFRLAAIAALLIMITRPESVAEVSFQLSFAAVLSLIAFYQWGYKRFRTYNWAKNTVTKALLYVGGVLLTTVIASLATMPLTLYHFQHFSALGSVSNILAVPLVTFMVMPLGVAALLAMPLGLEAIFVDGMAMGISWVISIAYYFAEIPGAVVHVKAFSGVAMALIAFGAVMVMLTRGVLRWFSVPIIALGIVIALNPKVPDILIAESGDTIAYWNGHALQVNNRRKDRYESDQWAQLYGEVEEGAIDMNGLCADDSCIIRAKENIVGYTQNFAMLPELCSKSNVVITTFPVENKELCQSSTIIDYWDLWRQGAHALYLDKPLSVETVERARGERPWTN